jgi:hypothetical protein
MLSKKVYAKSFRDLEAYQKAQALAQDIYNLTKAFPKEEIYSLTDQLRRSSRSVGAQIAEAWGKRRYERHLISEFSRVGRMLNVMMKKAYLFCGKMW